MQNLQKLFAEIDKCCGFQRHLMASSPDIPRLSVDHATDVQGGSPKMGLIERLKAKNEERKMSSPTILMTAEMAKLKKPSPKSSPDTSPGGTLERSQKPAKPRSPFLPFKNKRDPVKSKENGVGNKREKSPTPVPGKSLAPEHSNFILKAPDAAPTEPSSKSKLQSGGFIMKGRVIPPPPSRPPPKLKSEKPLPALPGEIIINENYYYNYSLTDFSFVKIL